MRFTRSEEDPLLHHTRQPHFVEIFFRGRRLDQPFVTEVAIGNYGDLRELAVEAARANEADPVKDPARYLVRVYEHRIAKSGPRRGARVVDYVPRTEEGGPHGYTHAA